MTVAFDQTGPEGTANSASSFLSTTSNEQITQSISLANATYTYSTWLRRLIGGGNVSITIDGVTWSTVAVTSVWTRFTLTQAQEDPVIGIQLEDSGDKIATAYNQLETGNAATSVIVTGNAAVTANSAYSLGNTGLLTFANASIPGSDVIVSWTGCFYYRCRFTDDTIDLNNMMRGLWELQKLSFVGSPKNKV